MDTRVSIITVTYNSESTFEKTIQSVLSQSVHPYEYIVVDGASSDGTLEIIKGYEKDFVEKNIELKVISEPDNGMYDAMNKGIRVASGDIIGIINSDDWYENIAVETVIKAYEEDKFDLFFADLRLVRPQGDSFTKRARNRRYSTSRDWNHPTTFITKEMYNKYEYRTDTIHDDYDLILRIKANGAKIKVVNKVIANFRMNGVSHEKSIKKAIERVGIKYKIYRRNGYSPFYISECLLEEVGKLIIG